MAGPSRSASPIKRLMTELQTYQSDPNDALLELGPQDDDVMHWQAVMKGVAGTAYEGTTKSLSTMRLPPHPPLRHYGAPRLHTQVPSILPMHILTHH